MERKYTHNHPGLIYLFIYFLRLSSAVLALLFYREKDSVVRFPRRP